MHETHDQNDTKYFDLHTTGYGYLNRIRTVKPKGSKQGYLACTVSAMRGNNDDGISYTKFDLRVVGAEAKCIIEALQKEVDANKAVTIGFKLGDIYPEIFMQTVGPNAGEPAVMIKGRLLQIRSVSVDGIRVDLMTLLPKAA